MFFAGVAMTAATAGRASARTGGFYVWMAGVCALIGFGGFSTTYWLQLGAGTFRGPPILHLHGAVFSAWLLLFLWQTVLAARGELHRHRSDE